MKCIVVIVCRFVAKSEDKLDLIMLYWKKWDKRDIWDQKQVLNFLLVQSMSRSTQVWCADQRQTGPFVAAAGCIVSLPGGKQTERCLECAVNYQLNREEWVFQIPTTAGGHDYTQQTGT